jgi:peptide/nickel transport system substrate-binding protein
MPTDMTQVAIISKQAAKASTEDFNSGKAAIGTGPYKLARYAKGDRIELARNDAYWGGKTPWEKVTLRLLPNDASRVAALLAGDVQAIEYVPTADVAKIRADKRLNVYTVVADRLIYLHVDSDREVSPSSRTGTASRWHETRSRMRVCARPSLRRSTARRSSTR